MSPPYSFTEHKNPGKQTIVFSPVSQKPKAEENSWNVREMKFFFPQYLSTSMWVSQKVQGGGREKPQSILNCLSIYMVIILVSERKRRGKAPVLWEPWTVNTSASHIYIHYPVPSSQLSLELISRITWTLFHRRETRFYEYLHNFPKMTR